MRKLLVSLVVLATLIVGAVPANAVTNNEVVIGCPGLARTNALVDPIVSPGVPSAHLHSFFGNKTINENSTPSSLRGQATTCKTPGQTSAYWIPTSTQVPYFRAGIYYSNRFFPHKVQIVPPNAELVIGPQPENRAGDGKYSVFYTCSAKGEVGTGIKKSNTPLRCPTDTNTIVVRFPNCWDGQLNPENVKDNEHFAYSSGPATSATNLWQVATGSTTACPASHPIEIVQTNLHVRSRNAYGVAITQFSNGPAAGMHGDFVQSWVTEDFQRFVDTCLNVSDKSNCTGVF